MANRVYISQYQLGFTKGIDAATSLMSELYLGRRSGAEATFYASVFQAGVHHLLLPGSWLSELPDNAFVRDKAISFEWQAAAEDDALIHEMFCEYLPENYSTNEKFKEVRKLEYLLADLCVCLRQNVSLLFPAPISEPESLRGILPPELLLPASRLLSAMGALPTAGPLPRYELQKTDVRIYNEIVHSGLFHEFSEAHVPLSDQEAASDTVLHRLRQAAARVQEEFAAELRLSRISVSLLPLVPKFIEETIGSFPGKVAEHFTKLADPWLENRKRLVVYDSSETLTEIFQSAMLYAIENRDDDAIVEERFQRHKEKYPDRFAEEPAGQKDSGTNS